MDPFNVTVAVLGALVLGLGLVSARLARSSFPPTLLALVAGVALGPVGLGLLDPLGAEHYCGPSGPRGSCWRSGS